MLSPKEYAYIFGTPDTQASIENPELYAKIKSGKSNLANIKDHTKDFNGQLKNDFWSLYLYGDILKCVYRKVGFAVPKSGQRQKSEADSEATAERFSSALSRAKARVFELASCNEFEFFCTFTIDPKKAERLNLNTFRKDFTHWIRNLNRNRQEPIKYLLIPEQHKKGGWHLHGLLFGLKIGDDLRPFELSEKIPKRLKNQIKSGETVYNWDKYAKKYGFFTATKIKDGCACSKYITKYIVKDFGTTLEKNQHFFFASQGLKGRETLVRNSLDKCIFDDFDFENDYVKIKTVRLQDIVSNF